MRLRPVTFHERRKILIKAVAKATQKAATLTMGKPTTAGISRAEGASANPSAASPGLNAGNTRLQEASAEVKADTMSSKPVGIESQAVG